MKSKFETAVVALAFVILQSVSTLAAGAEESGLEKLFVIADRLQQSDKPLDGVFRTVEALTNLDLPMARRVTSVSLRIIACD